MTRPQSEARLGFYPFPAPCLPALARHLRCRDPASTAILDPCAGEGEALGHLADALAVPRAGTHAIELDVGRSAILAARLEGARVLGPCSFFGARVSAQSFGLVYLNPPYGTEMGGGRRDELTFLVRAIQLLVPGGVLAFVLPRSTLTAPGEQGDALRRTIWCRLRDVSLWRPPADHREYGETVVLGHRRAQAVPDGGHPFAYQVDERTGELGTAVSCYDVPAVPAPPRWFVKTDWTDAELVAKLRESSLNRLFEPPPPPRRRRPPLALARGHVAMVLVAGELDGLVCPEGEPPHVLRGTAVKETYVNEAESSVTVDDDGNVTDKEVTDQRPVITVRVVDTTGKIRTFTDRPSPTTA